MKRMLRLLAVVAIFAGLFTLLGVKPAAASCVVASEAGNQFVIVSLIVGHSYTDTVTGAIQFSITFTAQFPGQIRFVGDWGDGTLDVLTDNTCGGPQSSFNPGDGRIDPHAADRLAVYCGVTTLDVWGIGKDSIGRRLFVFGLSDIAAAGNDGLTENLGGDGTISAGYYGRNTFGVSWIGGPLNGNGMADFRKTVHCPFDPIVPGSQPISTGSAAPGSCPQSVVVQPGDTLFRIATNHGTTVAELVSLNNLGDPNRIQVGQTICLPG